MRWSTEVQADVWKLQSYVPQEQCDKSKRVEKPHGPGLRVNQR